MAQARSGGRRSYRPIPALKKWMDDRGMTQVDLGRLMGVSGAQASRWLSGHRSMPASVAIKLSDITGIPAERLSNRQATTRLLKLLGGRTKSSANTLRNPHNVA
jgi:transcriptional regulator with XRE-family HTH domain